MKCSGYSAVCKYEICKVYLDQISANPVKTFTKINFEFLIVTFLRTFRIGIKIFHLNAFRKSWKKINCLLYRSS